MPIQDIKRKNKGSALLLVVIVTVLLSVIGIMFVMTMRIREMTTANVADDRDLDTAVGAVTGQIETVLRQDLFGTKLDQSVINGGDIVGGVVVNEASDSLSADPWLASLEPTWLNDNGTPLDPTDDWYRWDQLTNLYVATSKWDNVLRNGQPGWNLALKQFGGIVGDYQNFGEILGQTAEYVQQNPNIVRGLPADADGDGVADSIWAKLPSISTSRGKPVFAAIRIIDNCAMLNLNTANCFYEDKYATNNSSMFTKWWQYYNTVSGSLYTYLDSNVVRQYYNDGGRYLSEINYLPFLRGRDTNGIWGSTGDGWYNILAAKQCCILNVSGVLTNQLVPKDIHQILMNIENPRDILYTGDSYNLFDISDELEIRNRSLLTSLVESRFERSDIGNFTFDAGGGIYAALRIPRTNTTDSDGVPNFTKWKWRMDAANFDQWKPDGTLKTSSDYNYNECYKYDRRHLCTFYSFDRNIRSGSYPLLEISIANYRQTNPVTANALERVFRPLKNQPIDLRAMTDPTKLDRIIVPDPAADNLINCHRNILHLLYAFREQEYLALSMSGGGPDPNALIKSARKAAQQVANLIDYMDDDTIGSTGPFGMVPTTDPVCGNPAYGSQVNANPTYITKGIIDAMLAEVSLAYSGGAVLITPSWASYSDFDFGLPAGEVIYGYERQPFISEVYCNVNTSGVQVFALELVNPYQDKYSADGKTFLASGKIDLKGWRIQFGTSAVTCTLGSACVIPAAGSATQYGRLILWTANTGAGYTAPAITTDPTYNLIISPSTTNGLSNNTIGLGGNMSSGLLCLQRPDPVNTGKFITVDSIDNTERKDLIDAPGPGSSINVSSRDDSAWKFTNQSAYIDNHIATLGSPNGVTSAQKGYQLPVDNVSAPLDRLADFQKITWVDPNGLTGHIAAISEEGEIRYDSQVGLDLLRYVCTLSRQDKGIPGRININTAPLHVIAAAIPPQLVDPNSPLDLAAAIIQDRPYAELTELLDDAESPHVALIMKKYANSGLNPGDSSADNDLEERDWIFNRLSNIFTVRSDTFTAYILVRLGTDGPQRRMLAIFDRSNCWTAIDKPRLVALHPVPDPR